MTQSDPTSLIGGCWGSEIEDRVEKRANRYTYIYIYICKDHKTAWKHWVLIYGDLEEDEEEERIN